MLAIFNSDIASPCEILVASKMPQQRDLPQRSPRQNHLVEYPCNTLDGNRFTRQVILHRDDQAISALSEGTDKAPSRGQVKQAIHSVYRVIIPMVNR